MLLKKYIKIFPNILDNKRLSCILKCVNHINYEDARVGGADHSVGTLNKKIRDVQTQTLTPFDKSLSVAFWSRYLNQTIVHYMNEYLKSHKMDRTYQFIKNLNQLDILKYEEKNHYTFHIDDGPEMFRTLSAILFLNNDYEGGKLHFSDTDLDAQNQFIVENNPGTLVVWPSNMLFPHAVSPVTKGTRYTIVAWAK